MSKSPFEAVGSSSTVDLIFEGHGSIVLIHPVSPLGKTFLDENVGDSETMTFGGAIVCEPRFCSDIFRGAVASGLVCQ